MNDDRTKFDAYLVGERLTVILACVAMLVYGILRVAGVYQ